MIDARLAVAAAVVALAVPAPAGAQSTRYPAPVVDLDAEEEEYSDFWENAVEPGRDQYDELVDRAAKLIGRRADDAREAAIDLLDDATELLPERAEAWGWLGLAAEEDGDHASCRDDLEKAWRIDPSWSGGSRPLLLALGHCRAFAGDLDGAVEVLERLVARGDERVETLWRLGEVYMALGRLEDARVVLEVAVGQSPADLLYVHAAWALAVAADRARDPAATRAAGETALRNDTQLVRVEGPPGGYLVSRDLDYYRGLAADTAGLPERALQRFRRYLAHDDDGPWAGRAREHERALRGFDVADRVAVSGTDPLALEIVRKVVAAGDSDLRACLTKTPSLLVQLRVTLHGPKEAPVAPAPKAGKAGKGKRGKTPPPVVIRRPPTSVTLPPAGIRALVLDSDEIDAPAVAAALTCVEQVAAQLKLPTPITPQTWATVTAPVIWR